MNVSDNCVNLQVRSLHPPLLNRACGVLLSSIRGPGRVCKVSQRLQTQVALVDVLSMTFKLSQLSGFQITYFLHGILQIELECNSVRKCCIAAPYYNWFGGCSLAIKSRPFYSYCPKLEGIVRPMQTHANYTNTNFSNPHHMQTTVAHVYVQ